mmetsp:Transcript_92994/g.199440  ORF Transcript_92994/g.199440 Transcript_92994/m.199440 type:complete len:113 (-) Transcript_92994:171-509(-)
MTMSQELLDKDDSGEGGPVGQQLQQGHHSGSSDESEGPVGNHGLVDFGAFLPPLGLDTHHHRSCAASLDEIQFPDFGKWLANAISVYLSAVPDGPWTHNCCNCGVRQRPSRK